MLPIRSHGKQCARADINQAPVWRLAATYQYYRDRVHVRRVSAIVGENMVLTISFGFSDMHSDCSQGCRGRPQGMTPGVGSQGPGYDEPVDSVALGLFAGSLDDTWYAG